MKNLFIDCGTNLGQGLYHFNKKFNLFNNPNWDIYTFEPNPYINLDKMFLDVKNITKINKAIWINNTKTIEFMCKGKKDEQFRTKINEGRYQGGGSQLSFLHKFELPAHDESTIVNVETIDFNEFLKEQSKHYDKIYVKMDIEGAEFDIIDHLIQNDTLKLIYELYVELHGRFYFSRTEWEQKKKDIENLENNTIEKCKLHIPIVHKWF